MDTCSYLIPRNEFSRCPEYKLNFAYVSRNARKVERAGLYHAHFRLFRFLKQPSSGSYRLSLSGVQRIHTCVQWYRCFASFVACGPDVATYYIRYSTQRALFFRYRCIQIYIYTHLLTPWCRVLLEKLTGLQLLQKFPTFHATRRFITPLTGVRHLSLSWASPIQSIYPQPTSWRSILILSTHLCLGLPSGLLASGFLTKTLYVPLSSPIRATCPAHLILLDFITRTILDIYIFHTLRCPLPDYGSWRTETCRSIRYVYCTQHGVFYERRMVIPCRRFGTTSRFHLQGIGSPWIRISLPFKMGPRSWLETSVRSYHSTLRNIPEERRARLYRGGSPEVTRRDPRLTSSWCSSCNERFKSAATLRHVNW